MPRIITDAERQWKAGIIDWCKRFTSRVVADGHIKDTNTAVFTRSLAQVLARQFDRRYPALIARSMMQPAEPVNPGASSVIAQSFEAMGEATVTRDYQTEISRVEIQGVEEAMLMYGVLTSFFLGYQQLREFAMAGVQGAMKIQDGAFRIVNSTVDQVLSTGNATAGITGMINNANITVVQGGVGITGNWQSAVLSTDAQVIQDIQAVKTLIEASSIYMVDTLAVSPAVHDRLYAPLTLAGYAPNLASHIENMGIKIVRWNRLINQAASTTDDRCIMYENSLDVFNPLVAPGPEMFPPKQDDTGYSVAVHARCGGVEVAHNLGAYYCDMA